MKRIALACAPTLLLAGCGGQDTGIIISTPPPAAGSTSATATAPINANPTQPTANESFVNDAVSGTISSSTTGAVTVSSVGTSTLKIAYDATAKSYTLTAGGNSTTASATNLLANGSVSYTNPLFLADSPTGTHVYGSGVADSNDSIQQVVLATNSSNTVPSTAAQAAAASANTVATPDIQLSYVAAGAWSRATVNASNLLTADLSQFVYGAYTTDSQMPRTGSANYGVNITGTLVTGTVNNLFATNLSGYGVFSVNFGSGSMSLDSNYMAETSYSGATATTSVLPAVHAFTASATMSSITNAFSGSFSYAGSQSVTGSLNGKFYGPAAQEIGASFSGSTSTALLLGTIVGSRGNNAIK